MGRSRLAESLEDGICPACGGVLEGRIKGSTQGTFCVNCDWSVVTTYFPPIREDSTRYQVTVTSGEFRNPLHLGIVARLRDANWLAARALLKDPKGFVIFAGSAYETAEIRNELSAAGLGFTIEPPFPW